MRSDLSTRILAVVIAVFLWAYIRISQDTDVVYRSIPDVPVIMTGTPPAGLMPKLHQDDEKMSLRIKGPADRVNNVLRQEIRLSVDVTGITNISPQLVPVSVQLPPEVSLAHPLRKATIIVTPLEQQSFDVGIAFITQPPVGTRVGDYQIQPSRVNVEGPADAVGKVKYVTVSVDPNRSIPSWREILPRAVDDQGEVVENVQVLVATVKVRTASRPDPLTRQVAVRKPTLVNPARGYTVTVLDVRPDNVTIQGTDAAQLDALGGYIDTEKLDIHSLREDTTRDVRLLVPPGLTVTGSPFVRVDLKVEPSRP